MPASSSRGGYVCAYSHDRIGHLEGARNAGGTEVLKGPLPYMQPLCNPPQTTIFRSRKVMSSATDESMACFPPRSTSMPPSSIGMDGSTKFTNLERWTEGAAGTVRSHNIIATAECYCHGYCTAQLNACSRCGSCWAEKQAATAVDASTSGTGLAELTSSRSNCGISRYSCIGS